MSKLNITFDEVVAAKPKMIFYSANTVWWTHDPKDLQPGPVPLDIFGSPLFQTDEVEDFLNRKAIEQHPDYGKPENRINNFMMAHHRNIRNVGTFRPKMSFREFVEFIESHDRATPDGGAA